MKRRDVIAGLGAAAAWPLAVGAQQLMPVIGVLHSGAAEAFSKQMAVMRASLKDSGYVEGQNVAITYRWADSHVELLPRLASELVAKGVAVIGAFGGNGPTLAAKAATKTIPIVFATGADPVRAGLVASLSRPGGNATGVAFLVEQVGSKMLGLLRELTPRASLFGLLVNPANPNAARQIAEVEEAAGAAGVKLRTVSAMRPADLSNAFASLTEQRVGGVILAADPLFAELGPGIIELAARHRIPAIYYRREFADAGGLMSYGTSATESYARAGTYLARILKGESPAELPVFQVVKFEFVLNLKTAKALDLDVPPGLSARADEVIE